MKPIFGQPLPKQKVKRINPCLALYGYGPTGKKCKTCAHLIAKRMSNVYYKCDLRKITAGPGSDHRVNWPACGKYNEIGGNENESD